MDDNNTSPLVEDIKTEAEKYYELVKKFSTFQLIMDIGKFFLSIGVILVDLYLIIIICRNRRLRELKTNKIVMLYAVFNVLSFVSLPLFEFLIEVFRIGRYFGWHVYCMVTLGETGAMFGLFFCSFALTLEWLWIAYHGSVIRPIFLNIYNHLIKIILLFYLIHVIIDFIFCLISPFAGFIILADIILFISLVIFILVCSYLKTKVKNPTNKKMFPLTIATIMTFTWLPYFMYHLCELFFWRSYTVRSIISITFFIPEYLAFGSPIIVLVMLAKLNKYYKVAFTKSWCMSVKDYSGDDDNFEESEEEANQNLNSVPNNVTLL